MSNIVASIFSSLTGLYATAFAVERLLRKRCIASQRHKDFIPNMTVIVTRISVQFQVDYLVCDRHQTLSQRPAPITEQWLHVGKVVFAALKCGKVKQSCDNVPLFF